MSAPEKKLVKFKLNGRELTAPEGQLVIDAARDNGIDIPHYCYHPALGNPGNCRLCIVEVVGAPKPMVSCRLPVKEGLECSSESPAAKRAQASSVELHLVNHPLDCPVCDQSGECGLQDYYMKYGRYESAVKEDKLHKRKRTVIGPHVVLDQERCVLCTRCTRFTEKITKTNELGIFGRGHKEAVDLAPGKTLDNPYSGNVIDICPVGALTDLDFRFKVRVWYLDKTDSICPGCARGCSVSVHTNTKRPWHYEGRRVARLKPRYNPEVNGHWLCDDGRFGFKGLDEDRLGRVVRLQPAKTEICWNDALSEVSEKLAAGIAAKGAEGLVFVASGALSNEDWAALKKLQDALGAKRTLFTPEPDQVGPEDELLRRREKVPNLKGGEALGYTQSVTWDELRKGLESGKVWGLYCVERDPLAVLGDASKAALEKLELLVWQSPWKGKTGDIAHYRLPATAYVEEEGHFTNFQGKVQEYKQALDALGKACPDWNIFDGLREKLGAAKAGAR